MTNDSSMPAPDSHDALLIPASVGELIDKITILTIKKGRISDPAKRLNIDHEWDLLVNVQRRHVASSDELAKLTSDLQSVNETLWQIEDDIRDCERQQDFGQRFVELARSVYITNDRRSQIKREINSLVGSDLVEEKSYADYSKD